MAKFPKTDVLDFDEAPLPTGMGIADFDATVQPNSKMEFARQQRHAKAAQRLEDEFNADLRGELWTLAGTLEAAVGTRGKAFCLIYQGVHDDMAEAHSRGATVVFGPMRLIGDQKTVMAEAASLFTVDDITIKIVR